MLFCFKAIGSWNIISFFWTFGKSGLHAVHSVLQSHLCVSVMSTSFFLLSSYLEFIWRLCLSIRQSFQVGKVKEGAATKSNESFWKMPYQVMVQFYFQCIETFLVWPSWMFKYPFKVVYLLKEEKAGVQFVSASVLVAFGNNFVLWISFCFKCTFLHSSYLQLDTLKVYRQWCVSRSLVPLCKLLWLLYI